MKYPPRRAAGSGPVNPRPGNRSDECLQRSLPLYRQLRPQHPGGSLLRKWGARRFNAYSAGSFPKGTVHPLALKLLGSIGLPTDRLRSKSWAEFAAPGAPEMNFIFTVCDQAAGEVCPIWPGHPISAHWGMPDPAAAEGTEEQRLAAFRETLRVLQNRIQLFVSLKHEALDRLAATREVTRIGRAAAAPVSSQ
jgi:protein-tyrosine-phosphatase